MGETTDRRQTIVPRPNNVPYLVVVALMAVLTVIFVLGISYLRPTTDNSQLIATVIGFTTSTTAAVLAFMKSQETHLSVNSRLDAFMANAKLAARYEGITEGRQQGRDSANARTDALAAGPVETLGPARAPEPQPVRVEVVNQPLTVKTDPPEP